MKLQAPYAKSQFNVCMQSKFRSGIASAAEHDEKAIFFPAIDNLSVRRAISSTPGDQSPGAEITELRASGISIFMNVTNLRSTDHYQLMRQSLTIDKINTAMTAQGAHSSKNRCKTQRRKPRKL